MKFVNLTPVATQVLFQLYSSTSKTRIVKFEKGEKLYRDLLRVLYNTDRKETNWNKKDGVKCLVCKYKMKIKLKYFHSFSSN